MDILTQTYIVVGTGKSGIAAAGLLLRKGCKVYLYDGNMELDVTAFHEKNPELDKVEIYLGDKVEEVLSQVDVAVLSPGVPVDSPLVQKMTSLGITIWGEVELAYRLGAGRIVAITGTNGKTTTTSLTGEIMARYFDDVQVVGNIGIPYTGVADQMTDDTVVVAEISSFQLETIEKFAPQVSAILNITPDHLNRHHTMENYIAAKESITRNQKSTDTCVLNYEDEVLRKFGESLDQKVVFFSSERKLDNGLYVEGDEIRFAKAGVDSLVINVNDLNILGKHNFENVMAAVAMADAIGVPMDVIVEGLKNFHAVEHRIEFVCKKRDIDFYNDSKGTNPDAAIKGIQAMNRPTVLIGGGYDKESEYDEWIESFQGKVKKLVLIGQTREKIAKCCDAHNFKDYVFADSLEEAIDISYETAEPGYAILLSPACASWGMFDNYEQRGDIFKEYVRGLSE
ncbi:MAG: UDP-N-acetylmuramoyl-L-alanine--D-glutamate ligase [Lachnospiraceae bacterium]|nr:UDP-N-acetylmuramoyl-L-alanine--D-glutamate ligase [Lachnospiraceae bacterium]